MPDLLPNQVRLTDELVERSRSHALGKWLSNLPFLGALRKKIHLLQAQVCTHVVGRPRGSIW